MAFLRGNKSIYLPAAGTGLHSADQWKRGDSTVLDDLWRLLAVFIRVEKNSSQVSTHAGSMLARS